MRKVYMNRELSWLKFNERVLEEAENKKVPLCERLNFAAIYQSNLDEFFMVRVGSLVDQMLLKKDIRDNKTNLTPGEQIKKILAEVGKLNRRRNVVYDEIMEELEEYDICITDFKKTNTLNAIFRVKSHRSFSRRSWQKDSRFHFCEIKKSMQS